MPVQYSAVDRNRANVGELGSPVREEAGEYFHERGALLVRERGIQVEGGKPLVTHGAGAAGLDRLQAVEFCRAVMTLPNPKVQRGFAVAVVGLAVRAARTRNAARALDDAFSSQMPVSPVVAGNPRLPGVSIVLT